MFPSFSKIVTTCALLALPVTLGAAQLSDTLRISGFATLGASTVLEEGQEFRAYTFQQDGVRQGEVNIVNNTLFGLQGDLQLTDTLSATVQGVAYNNRESAYKLKADWAYLSYITDFGLTLRGGRFRLPLFNSSELTYIGYARSWVRPALPFYGVAGFEHYNGANLLYSFGDQALQYGLELGYGMGQEQTDAPNGSQRNFDSNDLLFAKATVEGELFRLGLTYFRGHSRTRVRDRNGVLINEASTLAQILSVENEFYLGAVTVDLGIGYGWTREVLPNELLAFAGASYQIDAWRPYALYSSKTFDHKEVDTPTPPPGAPPPPPVPGYVSEHIFSIGLRYDFMDQADLKVQIDRALGMQYNPQLLISDDSEDRKATVFTLAVDMVF